MKKNLSALLPLFGGLLFTAYASTASATLTTFQSYSGNVGLSVNGGGSYLNALPNGLTASIPAGSQVIAAYLYTSTYSLNLGAAGGSVPFATAGATFNGSNVTFTALTANPSSSVPLQAARADVTGLVKAAVNPSGNAATGGTYNFAVTETNTGYQDGEVLVAVYSNPSLPTSSIGILDGAASSAGDTSMINFSGSPAGDTVLMSIGDGFSYDLGGAGQQSTITVDGSLLTSAAGNCDSSQDGGTPPNPTYCTNGDLITAGTLGLNADGSVNTAYSNPFTPIGDTDDNTDHELYNISSLINPAAGNTITLSTQNTSLDDNIFLEAFDVNGLAGFNAPPPPPANSVTPEPQSLLYLGTGLAALAGMRRRLLRS
jgi:hypothetical protein